MDVWVGEKVTDSFGHPKFEVLMKHPRRDRGELVQVSNPGKKSDKCI
jgi:hypothetical protein